ncbi:MAG: hypothetical protein AABZ44_01760 [Elusimicrobiota bacterium]
MEVASAADKMQIEFYRGLSGEAKLKIISELNELCKSIAAAGARSAHPGLNDEQIRHETIKRFLPADLYQKAYPNLP